MLFVFRTDASRVVSLVNLLINKKYFILVAIYFDTPQRGFHWQKLTLNEIDLKKSI